MTIVETILKTCFIAHATCPHVTGPFGIYSAPDAEGLTNPLNEGKHW